MPWGAAAAAVASVAGSAISAGAAGDAANAQIQASRDANAATLAGQDKSLNWLKGIYNQTRTDLLPYQQQGGQALISLSQLLGLPVNAPYSGPPIGSTSYQTIYVSPDQAQAAAQIQGRSDRFLSDYSGYSTTPQDGLVPVSVANGQVQAPGPPPAPDPNAVQNSPLGRTFASVAGPPPDVTKFAPNFLSDPGYQFRLQQGLDAVNNSATAVGGVTGNTLKALSDYGQGTASQEFWQQYGAANSNYWNQNQAFNQDKSSLFNFLASLAGGGQGASVSAGNIGAGIGGNIANTITGTTNSMSNNIIGAGNAAAAGTVGTANAISGGFNSLGNNAALYYLMNQNRTPSTGMNNALGGSSFFNGYSSTDLAAG